MSDPAAARRTPAELVEAHLDRELALHRRLIAIAEAKRDALIANDMERLGEHTKREQTAAAELTALRPVRERLVKGLAQHLGITGEPVLSAVIAALDKRTPELEARRRELIELAQRLHDISVTNQELLRCGLRVIDGLLGMLVGAGPAPGGYDRRGTVPRQGTGGLLNIKT